MTTDEVYESTAEWVRLSAGEWAPVEPPPIPYKRHTPLRLVRDVVNASGRVVVNAGDTVSLVRGRRASPTPLGVMVPSNNAGKAGYALFWLALDEVEPVEQAA